MLYTDNIGLKKPAYSEPADIADINENSDIIDREFGNRYLKSETYSVEQANNAIAQAIEALPNGLVYRGAVNYYKDLPTANNELGDTYSVKYQGETGTTADGNEYAWGEYDGTLQWIKLGVNAYNKDEIDAMHDEMQTEIDANKSDILSAKNDIEKNSIRIGSRRSESISGIGWYRIFTANVKQTVRSGIIMINRAYQDRLSESHTILFNFGHAKDKFNQLHKLVSVQMINKIRLVYHETSPHNRPCYIDIYYNSTTENPVNVSVWCESMTPTVSTFNNSVFIASDFSTAEIPEGYKSVELDLTGGDVFDRLAALETALAQTQTE